jgi:NAD(P)-dependent dehydrogenase (short-subunit alcohol dehydrogenase family)
MQSRRVAFLSGAGGGIGAAIARSLAAEGCAVVLASRSTERCRALAESIRAGGGEAVPVELEVKSAASVRSAIERAQKLCERFGPIAWLVNNAGIAITAPLTKRSAEGIEDLYQEHLEVNFLGAERLTSGLLPDMLARGYGRIVNVASSAGLRGYAYASAYCASKHALIGYTLAAAEELQGKGVCVNAVAPHYVDSPMTDATVERIVSKTGRDPIEVRSFLAAQNPGGRLVQPEEVALAVLSLCEGETSGAILELDGGATPRQACPTTN